jgi:hypothetical protein
MSDLKDQGELYIRKIDRIFGSEPLALYMLALCIGAGCSAVFPDMEGLLEEHDYNGIALAWPHL